MFKLFTIVASALTFVASSGIGPNSMWLFYEPDVPESLKK